MMLAEGCFYLSLMIFLVGAVAALRLLKTPYHRGRFLSPVKCLLAGAFLSATMLFLPLHSQSFAGDRWGMGKALLLSVHSTMRLFVLDGEFDGMLVFTSGLSSEVVRAGYAMLAALLYVIAPILTFGFVLSFFKNISAYRALLFHYSRNIYVFSELNERTLVLAQSIKSKRPRCLIVFTDVFENNEESIFELSERARELKAVCFKKDIVVINGNVQSKCKYVSLFAMGEDESENIDQSIKLVEYYGKLPNFRLFIFSSSTESEVLFQTAEEGGMRIRRVNPIRSLINQNLYHTGHVLFRDALECGTEKLISVVVVGLGRYGTEMLKALTWFCQMDGYRVEIDAFDQDPKAEETFTMMCPELMCEEKNGNTAPDEAQYRITIHSGVDVDTIQFAQHIRKLDKISYIFVALGEDARNTKAAIDMRVLCLRNGQQPRIQTIVHNSLKKKALEQITDYRGHPYNIEFIGDMQSFYSEDVIIDSKLEDEALQRHLKWGKESDFWAYEFNYRSSVAAAIHLKMRIVCHIPGADKKEEELTEEEREIVEQLEHRRWNAYMRSEGYIFSGSTSSQSRNDLAKMHHNLVPFHRLGEEDKRKDSRVGTT